MTYMFYVPHRFETHHDTQWTTPINIYWPTYLKGGTEGYKFFSFFSLFKADVIKMKASNAHIQTSSLQRCLHSNFIIT